MARRELTPEQKEILISEVQTRFFLWNDREKNFKNVSLAKKAWEEIGKTLNAVEKLTLQSKLLLEVLSAVKNQSNAGEVDSFLGQHPPALSSVTEQKPLLSYTQGIAKTQCYAPQSVGAQTSNTEQSTLSHLPVASVSSIFTPTTKKTPLTFVPLSVSSQPTNSDLSAPSIPPSSVYSSLSSPVLQAVPNPSVVFSPGLQSSSVPSVFTPTLEPSTFSSSAFSATLEQAPVSSSQSEKSQEKLEQYHHGFAVLDSFACPIGLGSVTPQLSSTPLVYTGNPSHHTEDRSAPHQLPAQGHHVFPPANFGPPPVSAVTSLTEVTNSYRLGNHKKPTYAQPTGLTASSPTATLPTKQLHIGPPAMEAAAAATLQYQSAENAAEKQAELSAAFTNQAQVSTMYRPVYHHWFYKKEIESKVIWRPFSMVDSLALEEAFTSTDISPETVVATDGGRYDVNILRRQRLAVYWQENPTEVRRCSWFYKGSTDTRYVPYEENVSTHLEEEYKIAFTTNVWHRRIEFPNGETVVYHGPNVMVHFLQAVSPDAWGNTPQTPSLAPRPRIVKRGVDEFDIDEGEPPKIDHLLFLVHGIGSVCDLKFRTVEEVVDDFRSLSLQLVQSHFRTAQEQGKVNRIEVLPISWHATLHGEDTGIDRKLKSITLNSIPKLRHFTNDTLLDILFYTSPVYCQTIMHTVGKELNRLYKLFKERNPLFEGGVSLGGHSLGSLILFDLLYHQKPPEDTSSQELVVSSDPSSSNGKSESYTELQPSVDSSSNSKKVSYLMGTAGTGQPFITYPQLNFQPVAFFALGSPIGMFVTVRGIETLGEDFKLPTCSGFYNIFHPFDPVAYRIETLVNPELTNLRPVLIPHHKGRKRMHLELKETMARVGADLKQRLVESVRSTWNTVYQLAMFHRTDEQALQQEVDKVLEEHLHQENVMDSTTSSDGEVDSNVRIGQLNGGRRIDYVLQEAPLESFNEYLFALKTHVCYWESEDTMLMILKEIYSTMGISGDSSMQQNTPGSLSTSDISGLDETGENRINLPSSSSFGSNQELRSAVPMNYQTPALYTVPDITPNPVSSPFPSQNHTPGDNPLGGMGMDPTAPLAENRNLGPPPITGFVKKTKS